MTATLYEALGIPQTATDEEVRATLRGHIRKYYAQTRDGKGNVEEALRFINHASRILGNPALRAEYDRQLALAQSAPEQRIAHVVAESIAATTEENTEVHANLDHPDDTLEQGLDAADPVDVAFTPHHPGLTERVASFHRSPIITVAVCGLFAAFIAAAILFVTPEDAVLVAKQVLVWITLTLLALTVVYGVVHGLAWMHRRRGPVEALVPNTDLAIHNWRREKSVFLGTNAPQEDASWIFQLRMAELERAKSGRTSEVRPWGRLAARVFDYAIWGLVLALLLSELRALEGIPDELAYWLSHPLVAPIVITATWIPIEALLIASIGTTPGRWLFGVYLQFSISDAYARRDPRAQLMRALRRGFRVWWQGLACGVPVLAPITIALAYERLLQRQETDWDAAQDCLVTHGSPAVLNLLTGVCGLVAMLWLYAVAWHQPLADTMAWVQDSTADLLVKPPAAVQRGIANGDRMLEDFRSGLTKNPVNSITDRLAGRDPNARAPTGPVDPEIAEKVEGMKSRVAALSAECPRMLHQSNYRRAVEVCGAWADLEMSNAEAWRSYGEALQAQGYHQKALAALRKAKQIDPNDARTTALIERSQHGIVSDFMSRYRSQ
jgi:hypothetical protein